MNKSDKKPMDDVLMNLELQYIENHVREGNILIGYKESTSEEATKYECRGKNPLFLETIFIKEDFRLKGLGSKVLKYVDSIAKKNGYDAIFGEISEEIEFTKENRGVCVDDVTFTKFWLHSKGYAVNMDNNYFHKVIKEKLEFRKIEDTFYKEIKWVAKGSGEWAQAPNFTIREKDGSFVLTCYYQFNYIGEPKFKTLGEAIDAANHIEEIGELETLKKYGNEIAEFNYYLRRKSDTKI